MNLQPVLSPRCTDCPACAHQFAYKPGAEVIGNCGDKTSQGDCTGVIYYPVKNQRAHAGTAKQGQARQKAR